MAQAQKVLVMAGTLKDGYTFYGPFSNYALANKFAEKHFKDVLPTDMVELHEPGALTPALKKAA